MRSGHRKEPNASGHYLITKGLSESIESLYRGKVIWDSGRPHNLLWYRGGKTSFEMMKVPFYGRVESKALVRSRDKREAYEFYPVLV